VASKKGRGKKRGHVYRGPRDRGGGRFTGLHRCPECGKWCYLSRADAETTVRQVHQGSQARYYRCGEFWHYTSMEAGQVQDIRTREAVLPDDPGGPCEWDDWADGNELGDTA
jgi:hypothetical protein